MVRKNNKSLADQVIEASKKKPQKLKKMYYIREDLVIRLKEAAEKANQGESDFLADLLQKCFSIE